MKVALGIALVVTGVSAASVRFGRSAQADEPKGTQADPKISSQVATYADSWSIEGVVVDEQSRPVAGASVRTMAGFNGPPSVEQRSDGDGGFRFTLSSSPRGLLGVMAEAENGTRLGLDRSFDSRPARAFQEPVRIVLKPSRPVTVRVKDSAGAPVSGATVEAAETLFRTHAMTAADGTAKLRIAADARIDWVIGFKPKAGFDYFETYDTRMRTEFRPIPDEVALTLEGTQSVRSRRSIRAARPCPASSSARPCSPGSARKTVFGPTIRETPKRCDRRGRRRRVRLVTERSRAPAVRDQTDPGLLMSRSSGI